MNELEVPMLTELRHPALFANFYFPRSMPLPEWFARRLERPRGQNHVHENGVDVEPSLIQDPVVAVHYSPYAHDSTIIQVALNSSHSAEQGWRSMREQLERALDVSFLNRIWGYSLYYQAAYQPGADNTDVVTRAIPFIWQLYGADPMHKLAHARTAGGDLWLLAVPTEAEGPSAASVYLALCPTVEEDRFVSNTLWGKRSSMLIPDLIAHKGYAQLRDYRIEGRKHDFDVGLKHLRNATRSVLRSHQMAIPDSRELRNLAHAYDEVAVDFPEYSLQLASQKAQIQNLSYWQDQIGQNSILDFHRRYIEMSVEELELMIASGHETLDAASKAVDLANVQLSTTQEIRQRRAQWIFAVLGTAFAVPQLIDQTVANDLLRWFASKSGAVRWVLDVPAKESVPREFATGWLVVTQIAIILVVLAVVVVLMPLLNRRDSSADLRPRQHRRTSL